MESAKMGVELTEHRKGDLRRFRIAFTKALPLVARDRARECPGLEVSEHDDISFKNRQLRIESLWNYRLILEVFCTDLDYSISFWPYFDEMERVRYTVDPDNVGFSDPVEFARHCVSEFINFVEND
ncbi:MAG: hypothetical protein ACREMY_22535 [bacterium]